MLTIDDIKDFKLEKRKIILPKNTSSSGNLIFLPYLNTKDCHSSIKNMNLFFNRQNYWKYILKDYKYNFKLFNRLIRYNNIKERNNDYDYYEETDKGLTGVRNIMLVKNKNCFVDLSKYMEYYFNFRRYNWKVALEEFFDLLHNIIHREEYKTFDKKILLLDLSLWDVSRQTIINKYNLLNNPFSIFYLAMKKNLDAIKALGDVTVIVTDAKASYFLFNTGRLDKLSYLDFKIVISKLKSDILDSDLDDDTHLNKYGTTSSKAPEDELNKATKELNQNSNNDLMDTKGNNDGKESIMDQIARAKGGETQSDNDDDEEEPDDDDDINDEEDSDDETAENNDKSDSDVNDELEDELLDEVNNTDADEEAAQEVKKIIEKEVPNKAVSAREKKLIEEEKKIKLSSGITLEELVENKKNNPSFIDIESYNIEDKVNTLNSRLTKVTYPNFEKSYNEKSYERDLIMNFKSLSEKKDLPVYIRSISKTDTSDSLNLKETLKIELEDAVYGRRHTFTIDIPKFVEDKFMYLGGNKKIFIKQLILKPIVKIAPDTVQICSNYSKIFMYRYGDNISPMLQNVIKIIATNDKLFKVKRGNGTPFNTDYKTTIEYDVLAKSFLSVRIKKSNVFFIFSQKEIDKIIEEIRAKNVKEDIEAIDKIDRDKQLIIGYELINGKYKFLTVSSDESALITTGFNNGEDIDPDESSMVENSVIDYIIKYIKDTNDVDINKLITEAGGAKIGKKYIYSRCKIMKKFVPTILLLSYCEGLTTVLKKAKINYSFSDKRPKFESNVDKLQKGVIPFANGYLIFDRFPIQNSLLMNAFTLVDTRAYNFEDMDIKGTYLDIFGILYNSRIIASAFDSFYDNMIDPITKELLESMHYPTEFVPLLLVANLLLSDNNFSSEINMNNFRVRSNEMVSAMLYKIIANAYSKYKRTASNKTPIKITVPQSALIKELVTSQSVEDYSILNPQVECDKSRAITAKGPSGINLEESYTEEKRSFDDTMLGLMAMSTSPKLCHWASKIS